MDSSVSVNPLAALGALSPPRDGPVVVLTAPWTSAAEVVERAGGAAIGVSSLGPVALGHAGGAGFAADLRRGGAWAVLDGRRAALICGVAS